MISVRIAATLDMCRHQLGRSEFAWNVLLLFMQYSRQEKTGQKITKSGGSGSSNRTYLNCRHCFTGQTLSLSLSLHLPSDGAVCCSIFIIRHYCILHEHYPGICYLLSWVRRSLNFILLWCRPRGWAKTVHGQIAFHFQFILSKYLFWFRSPLFVRSVRGKKSFI